MRDACHFGSYLIATLLLYIGLAATLIVRRRLTIRLHSGVTILSQRREHKLCLTGAVLGSAKRKRQPYVLLDGVQFPLRASLFMGRTRRLAALQVLRTWTDSGAPSASPGPSSPAVFLSILDVVSIEGETVHFRAIWSSLATYAFIANALIPSILLVVMVVATPSTLHSPEAFDAALAVGLLANLGIAMYLRLSKPTIAITAGKWADVFEHGETFKTPPWQARFEIVHPNPANDDGPAFPQIELKYGKRSLKIHSSSRYDADELEDFAERMNHFLWGGPTQPQDPAKIWASRSSG
jgi:hypothetical protein